MINNHSMHLNPRPYLTAPHVKFHIQRSTDVEGVAMCGGIFAKERYSVFSPSFVYRMDEKNQCLSCVQEFEQIAQSADSLQLSI